MPLGTLYYEKKEYITSEKYLTLAIELNAKDHKVYNSRGLTYSRWKKWKLALQDFSKAILLHDKYVESYNNRGYAKFQLQRYSEAISDWEKAIEYGLPKIVLQKYIKRAKYLLYKQRKANKQ